MSESVAVSSVPATVSKKSKSVAGAGKKPKAKATHPKTAEMVKAAISDLKERGGSSLQAIKKYISANYKVDADKVAPFIRNYLKSAVSSGSLVQTKGKGASGSFKLAEKKPAKNISKPKSTKAKKSVIKSKASAGKKPKSAPKAKKAKKVPTKKPKAPKPKKVGTTKVGATKKPAAAKK